MNLDALIGGAVGALLGSLAALVVGQLFEFVLWIRSWAVALANECKAAADRAGKKRRRC